MYEKYKVKQEVLRLFQNQKRTKNANILLFIFLLIFSSKVNVTDMFDFNLNNTFYVLSGKLISFR